MAPTQKPEEPFSQGRAGSRPDSITKLPSRSTEISSPRILPHLDRLPPSVFTPLHGHPGSLLHKNQTIFYQGLVRPGLPNPRLLSTQSAYSAFPAT